MDPLFSPYPALLRPEERTRVFFAKLNICTKFARQNGQKMKSFLQFLKDWMLPVAMTTGVGLYLCFHFTPALHPAGPVCSVIVSKGQQIFIAVMLFLQFVRVSPLQIRMKKWHVTLLAFQAVSFAGLAAAACMMDHGYARILVETAMLCFICPTASASGVITDRLGGSLPQNMSYVVFINALATLMIPAVIPVVHPGVGSSFLGGVSAIARHIFPMLLLPCLLAWLIRYCLPSLHEVLCRYTHWAFYLWSIGLIFAMILATRALVLSGLGFLPLLGMGLVACACCLLQFACGRLAASRCSRAERITAGQALGQKNTGFMIWLGYSFMTPVTAIAGGFYSIVHNLVNSWELYRKRTRDLR